MFYHWKSSSVFFQLKILHTPIYYPGSENKLPTPDLFTQAINAILKKFKNHFFLNPLLLDLAILPLVAFDEYGFRLGMGKGYYDLTFQKKKNQKKPILWGLCYDFQETKTCYPESHDLKMDAILSPSGIRNF